MKKYMSLKINKLNNNRKKIALLYFSSSALSFEKCQVSSGSSKLIYACRGQRDAFLQLAQHCTGRLPMPAA